MKPIFYCMLGAMLTAFSFSSNAQCPNPKLMADSAQWVVTGPSTIGSINVLERVNNTLYLGGYFNYVGRYTGSFIGLDTSTGLAKGLSTFPKFNGVVHAAIPDGSGGMIVSGDFSMVGTSARACVAQINSAGLVTTLNISANNDVYTLLLHNGILYLGGDFTTINSTARNRVAAVNLSTGALVNTWNPNCNNSVYALATDGTNIYVGGIYSSIGAATRYSISAVDITTGAINSWAPASSNMNAEPVYALAVANGNLYIGGDFGATIGGQSRTCAACVSVATGLANSWQPNTNNLPVRAMALSGDKLFVGGDFTIIGGQSRSRLAALDTAGTGLPTAWNPNAAGTSATVYALSISGNTVFAGGTFATIGGQNRYQVASIDMTSGAVRNMQTTGNSNCKVAALVTVGNTLYAGGDFISLQGETRDKLAAINLQDNTLVAWSPTITGTEINAITSDNGKLYIGGVFSAVNGNAREDLASFDIASNHALNSWNPFGIAGTFTSVRTVRISGAYAYIGGTFNYSYSGSHLYITRVDKTTGITDSWAPVLGSSSNNVSDISISGSDLYFGGTFRNAGNGNSNFAKCNISSSVPTFFSVSSSSVNTVYAAPNKVFFGGGFDAALSSTRYKLAAVDLAFSNNLVNWTASLTSNSSWFANKIKPYRNMLLVGGYFTSIGSKTRTSLAVTDTLNGAVYDAWAPSYTIYRYPTNAMMIRDMNVSGDEVFVAGEFDDVNGKKIVGLARHLLDFTPPAVTISVPKDSVCASTSVTVTAANAPSGSNLVWKNNGTVVQTGTNTTYIFTPVQGDTIICEAASPATACNLGTGISNKIGFKVTANITPTASITVTDDTICAGTKITFTATTNVPGATYQWKNFTTSIGTNSDTFAVIPSGVNSYSCTITKAAGWCFSPSSIVSNSIIVQLYPTTTPNVTIAVNTNPVCAGKSDTVVATTNFTGGTYQWFVNGSPTGSNNGIHIFTPANNDKVKLVVTVPSVAPQLGCYSPSTDTSNEITITTNASTVPTLSIAGNTSICQGTSTTYTATTNVTGGNYQWKVNGVNTGVNAANHNYIPANGDVVSCVVTTPSSPCYSSPTVASNNLSISVTPKITPTISISGPAQMSIGSTVNLTATLTGAGSGYTIRWVKNSVQLANTVVPNTSYTKGPGNDNIFAVVRPSATCADSATSVTITVQQDLSVSNNQLADGISIYPNPVSQVIYADGLASGDHVTITGIDGRKTGNTYVAEKQQQQHAIPVGNLVPGTYIISIHSAEGQSKGNVRIQKL